MKYGLTDSGFIVKPFEVILEEQKADFRVIFGDDIDLSPQSVAGAYCYNQAIKLTQIWELLGGLYAISDINSADGVYLDRLANLVNAHRIPASNTTVSVALWGDTGTVIPSENILRDENTNEYTLRNQVTLSENNTIGIAIKIKSSDEDDVFTITMDGVSFTFTAPAEAEKIDVKGGLADAIRNHFTTEICPYDFDTSDDDILKLHLKSGVGKFTFTIDTPDTLELNKVATIGIYDCTKTGKIYVGERQINEIVTKVSGLDECINYIQGETGKNTQEDDSFRLSIKNRQKNASGNEVAIENAILKVSDVEYARVYSNRTLVTDSEGRPGKSFEAIVIGGDDKEIAKAIFNSGPAGIEAYGTQHVPIIDDIGTEWNIGFSRPVNRYVFMKIGYSLNSEETPPENIADNIKQNILKWSLTNLSVGTDLILQKLYTPIYQVSGVKNVNIRLATSYNKDQPPLPPEYVSEDIIVAGRDIAIIMTENIEVTQNV